MPSPLIHSSLVNLTSQELRREFIKHIGNEYDSIIASDITGKASRIDQEMGSEYERYSIAKGLATSVFLYSFSGGERRGASHNEYNKEVIELLNDNVTPLGSLDGLVASGGTLNLPGALP
ncbi:MAG: hypothetical protein AB1796_04605 [Bacillota bacterium]